MMMDDNAPAHERRKLVKTYKIVLPRKWTMDAEVCGETYSKTLKKIYSRKLAIDVKYTPQNHGERGEREREKERIPCLKLCDIIHLIKLLK